ncbi:MAG TPA: MmgE/PrpD family protein [Syntrophales bacterium]|nr:MmgE/PrpD family protein [Syntrophales bacterium]
MEREKLEMKKLFDRPLAETLSEFCVGLKFEDLPDDIIDKVKYYIIDVIGCSIRAREEKQIEAVVAAMTSQGGNPDSSVIARGFKTSPINAAFINGTMGHIYDYDDDHREGTMHPSVSVFPAVFALGEKYKVSGKEFLRAFICGLEVMIRTGEAFLGKTYYQGFHPTGTCGVFGAAMGSSLILGLNAQQTSWALGLGGSFAAGTLEWGTEGSWQKPIQAGQPAMSGIICAELAKQNFIGARTIYEGPMGFIRAYSYKDTYDYGKLINNLGQKWEMKDTSIKVHACCRFGGPIADCALDLYKQGVRADNVEKIVAKACNWTTTVLMQPEENRYRPKTHVDAQFSLPYITAVAISRNRTGVDEFKKETFTDPKIIELASKVTAEFDPEAEKVYPKAYPATMIATMKDGTQKTAHVDYPKGDPENPVTMDEVEAKFNMLASQYLDAGKRMKFIETVKHIEDVKDISVIANLIR